MTAVIENENWHLGEKPACDICGDQEWMTLDKIDGLWHCDECKKKKLEVS
jgi:ribosomal protein L37AE/L43A